jgi:hypothetical protein
LINIKGTQTGIGKNNYFSLGQKNTWGIYNFLLIFFLKTISNKENSKLSQIAHTKGIGENIIFP